MKILISEQFFNDIGNSFVVHVVVIMDEFGGEFIKFLIIVFIHGLEFPIQASV